MSFLQEGGQLYTWGGAFEATASESLPLTPRLPSQKDDHHGCLGHGDKVGKLKPIRCETWLLIASKEAPESAKPWHSASFCTRTWIFARGYVLQYVTDQHDTQQGRVCCSGEGGGAGEITYLHCIV